MPTTVRIPLALLTVQPDSSNAFWTASTGTNVDEGHIAFADSGEGIATFWGIVPTNVNATENWNLDFYHVADASGGGNAVVSVGAIALSDGGTLDGTYTLLSSAATFTTYVAGSLAISAVSGGTFDSVLALSSNEYLYVEVNRHGGNSNDTLGVQWNLKAVTLKLDI